ncbi:hypothetical protein AZE42_07161 [Rhizopogon vesiculosus]|uniref:Uncharacterized protein n=1 Tax=Rhizopogon vesiculosus TaxID=180088 RepID=A0A1J8PN80_9AGAM|nr:hypothetical protein AZE42_07161 [Rhizopogon vesiculosus]
MSCAGTRAVHQGCSCIAQMSNISAAHSSYGTFSLVPPDRLLNKKIALTFVHPHTVHLAGHTIKPHDYLRCKL